MSWTASFDVKAGDIGSEQQDQLVKIGEGLSEEALAQFGVATLIAAQIIDGGLVGDPKGEFRVVVGGHANPGHKVTPGWANDALNINIYQTAEPNDSNEE